MSQEEHMTDSTSRLSTGSNSSSIGRLSTASNSTSTTSSTSSTSSTPGLTRESTMEEVCTWVGNKFGPELGKVLLDQEIDGDLLFDLTKDELINKEGPYMLTDGKAKKLIKAIKQLVGPTPIGSQGGHALATETEFWNALQNCTVDPTSKILSLPNGLHFLGNPSKRSSLYVRDCYEEMKNLIFAQLDRYEAIPDQQEPPVLVVGAPQPDPIYGSFVVTGNPGIGKSCFLYYLMMELKFSSKYVQVIAVRAMEAKDMQNVMKNLSVPKFLHSPLGGSFFEAAVHRILPRGGTFKRRNLRTSIQDTVVFPQSAPSTDIMSITDIETSPDNIYLQPKYGNFPAIDSLIKQTTLFQVTVSLDHPPLMQELSNIIDQLGDVTNVQLYFVLPPDQYPLFKEQHYLTTKKIVAKKLTAQVKKITQYALLVEFAQDITR
ncbi:hypothetical protein SAMD00019534_013710, partial [Acytostelium subglobosum LB1]|uniref:hypothetical protein n=1 Tax=Acytostelium subglobosum LB1 TaxID=1410327 RepID=UPI0006450A9A